jgi:putative spermidine/putrescine transport system substrate-binding protein
LLWIDFAEAQLLAREGLLAKVSQTELPNLRDIREEAKSTLGVAPITFASALGFLYNSTRIERPPVSWADLWHSRFVGELALFDFGSSLGPVTLVMAARLNGGNETNIDPGFEKLFQLKSNAFGFRTSGPENNKFVAQGEAGVTLALASQTRELKAAGATVEWVVPAEGAVALPQGFQIVAGSRQRALAQTFVNYVLSLEVQQRIANDLLMVVPNRKVVLDPLIAPFVPLENILYLDFETIGMRRGEWTNRFNREILGG